jgi:hypothetical protein
MLMKNLLSVTLKNFNGEAQLQTSAWKRWIFFHVSISCISYLLIQVPLGLSHLFVYIVNSTNRIDWFQIYVQSSSDIFSSSYVHTSCYFHVQTPYPFQCTKVADIHDDLRQLSYGSVTVRSYSRYDVNGFHFRSAPYEVARPRTATVNSGVVTRAINEQGQEINYYGITQ